MLSLLLLPLVFGSPAGAILEDPVVGDLEALAGEAQLRSFLLLADLDESQVATLAQVTIRLEDLRRRYLEHRLSILRIQRVSFETFLREDLDGGEFTALTTRNTGRANRMGKDTRSAFVEELRPLGELASEILDPGQLLLLELLEPEDFAACALGPKERAPGSPLPRQAWGAVDAVAGKKGQALEREARGQAERILDVAAREGVPAHDRAAEGERIAALLQRAAFLSEDARERCLGVLTKELLPRTEAIHAREGLHHIHEEEYPDPGTLMRMLLAEGAADVLAGGVRSELFPPDEAVRRLEAEVEDMRRQISLLNLLNGLHLTRDQLEDLAAIGDRAGTERPAATSATPSLFASLGVRPATRPAEMHEEARAQLGIEMERLRQEFRRGRLPTAKAVKEVASLAGFPTTVPGRLPKERDEAYRAEVLDVLTPAQEQVLFDFTDCLIPPLSLRDSVRVRQARNHEQEMAELGRMRGIPAGRFAGMRQEIAEETLSRIEKVQGVWPERERPRVLANLLVLMDEVRALDDAAFAVQSEELVERLRDFGRRIHLRGKLTPERTAELGRRASGYLLDPHVAGLAREIAAHRARRGAPDPVDLETILPAPSCKDGKCAVD